MVPRPDTLLERANRSHSHSSSGGGSGVGIGGGVVAAIVILMIIIFVWVYLHQYSKAKRIRADTGAPIKHSTCFKKALLLALTFGCASLFCVEWCGLNNSNNGDVSGGGGAPQKDQSGGFVQQPMPSYQPQINWAPIQGAAIDPVQG